MKLFSLMSVSALWIALMGIFWIASLCQISSLPFVSVAAIILFLVTFAVYAMDHASGSREDLLNNPERAILAKYPIKLLAIVAYFAAIIITFLWDASKLFAVVVPGIAGALYTVRIGNMRPKDLPGVKTLIVATSTAICRAGLIRGAWWLYVLVFLVMIIDTVLCDMRDIKGDTIEGVRTIPVVFGRERTLAALALIDMLIFVISPIVAAIGLALIIYFRKERGVLKYDLLVDGWMMWVVLILLLAESPPIAIF